MIDLGNGARCASIRYYAAGDFRPWTTGLGRGADLALDVAALRGDTARPLQQQPAPGDSSNPGADLSQLVLDYIAMHPTAGLNFNSALKIVRNSDRGRVLMRAYAEMTRPRKRGF